MPDYELNPDDIFHKSQLHRLLIEIVDHEYLAQTLAFKGGTCAAMLGYLDRFSVDLDFDVLPGSNDDIIRDGFTQIFRDFGYELKLAFDKTLFFQVRYKNPVGRRNNLKVSANSIFIKSNEYKIQYFSEIDRLINSQTIETMFANKLVAVLDRFSQHNSIAGRDVYDIHHFFMRGYQYNKAVIIERTGKEVKEFLLQLFDFIKTNVNQTVINEDLNSLLAYSQFRNIRKILLPETLSFLDIEIKKQP